MCTKQNENENELNFHHIGLIKSIIPNQLRNRRRMTDPYVLTWKELQNSLREKESTCKQIMSYICSL